MSPQKDMQALQRIYELYDLQRDILQTDPQALRSQKTRKELESKVRSLIRLANQVRPYSRYLGGVDALESSREIQKRFVR